jgi:hypothetical protein
MKVYFYKCLREPKQYAYVTDVLFPSEEEKNGSIISKWRESEVGPRKRRDLLILYFISLPLASKSGK